MDAECIMATAKSKTDGSRKKTGGRKKGSVNVRTALLKDAILEAAEKAGNKKGMIGYLEGQAKENPTAFMTLLGKVLPTQVDGNMTLDATDRVVELFKQVASTSRRIGS